MAKSSSRQQWKNGLWAIFLILALIGLVSGHSESSVENQRPDIIMIDLPAIPGGEYMPAVQFFHDRHTEALKGQKNCTACHQQKDDQLVFMFKRLENTSTQEDMEIYHSNCMGCHMDTAAAGKPAGPVTGDCRSCHKATPSKTSSRRPINFDKSLHYRHVSAKTIRPTQAPFDVNCSACHHKFDKSTQKTVYLKGKEESCQYCHKEEKTDEARSLQSASHDACVNCHQQLATQGVKAGPVNCQGCHDSAAQQSIERVKDVPRMQRNQPDVALLASWATSADFSDPSQIPHMNPVAFNHIRHEASVASCKSCHHASLGKCSQCHTATGDEKGGFITIEQAMHNRESNNNSCIGCHAQTQASPNCAGCHNLIGRRPIPESTCNTCHAVDKTALKASLSNSEAMRALAQKVIDTRPTSFEMLRPDQIPEKVTINAMADKYEPAVLPHRKIVNTLASQIKDNRMATLFHGERETLCMGCHHNSPATTQPPKCAACHGEAYRTKHNDGRPGLLGAYHGQCIACHQAMEIDKPAATDCTACHKQRNS
jgi:hypothetical protein